MNNQDLLIVTTNEIAGREISEVIGVVFGVTVRSKNIIKSFGAGLKSIVGGEIEQFTEMIEESRDQALEKLVANAKAMGADAIIAVRFDSDAMGNEMEEITAYGTAVKLK